MSSFSGGAPTPAPQPAKPGPTVVPPRKPEKPRRRAGGMILAAIALTIALGWLWMTKAEAIKGGKGSTFITVPTVAAAVGPVTVTIRVTGTFAAQNSATLTAPRILGSRSGFNRGGDSNFAQPPGGAGGGPGGADFNLVLLTLSKPGTQVKAGDVVAQFDPQNQLLRLDDYKDSVVQLENNLKSLLASTASLKEAHDQQVRSAQADWNKAVLDLQTAPIRADIDVEKYKLAVEEADATFKALTAETALVEESQRAQIRAAQLNLDQSRIELQRADNNVQKMTIKAPMDGIVVMASIVRNGEFGQIREGDQVNAGQPFLSIVDPRSMVLDATVNQVDAERLRLGMKALVHVDAYPNVELPATVTGIGAMSKTSTFRASYVGELPVRIHIDKVDPHLIPDLTGSSEIVLGTEAEAVTIPRNALFEEEDGSYVYKKEVEGWAKVHVQIGAESYTTVAIHSGLQKGDVVALQRPM